MGQYEPRELTARHRRALGFLAEGMRLREVADRVGLSVSHLSAVRTSERGRAYARVLEARISDFETRSHFVRRLMSEGMLKI